jgi:predicted Zn-dependent protease
MFFNWRLATLLVFITSAGTSAVVGERDRDVSLNSVLEIWGDVLRDADTLGFRLTRLSDEEEVGLGIQLNTAMFGQVPLDPEWDEYVAEVGASLVPHVNRRGVPYTFRMVDSPILNAFALPGGRVYITRGLLGFLENEAELAAILGHEMSHVDLRHCVERFQYQIALDRLGLSQLGRVTDVAHPLVMIGYGRYEELEADANGLRLSTTAGYDPSAAAVVFRRMQQVRPERPITRARTPVGEAIGALVRAIGGYFQSHPGRRLLSVASG